MHTKYERQSYQFLSAYRFISYALAVMFIQVLPPLGAMKMTDAQIYTILSVLGVYTILRVFSPLRWRERSPVTYAILTGDFLICILLVVFTNGLSSIFLLYSLTPTMTAALLFEEKLAILLAFTASLTLSLTHLFLSQFSERITWIMQGHNLTLLIIYTFFCFVTAQVPYRINLNIRRRIERDAIIEERRRIGREIHDGLAQSLSYLSLKTKLVRESLSSSNTEQALLGLEEINKVAQITYEDIRESIDQLTVETRNRPLVNALADHVKQFGEKNGIWAGFDTTKSFPQLSPVAELQLLRIAQEALTNIRRHAHATKVEVKLNSSKQLMEMIIKDNGRGFNAPRREESGPGYHGLTIIKERAESLGGIATISSAPGEGTEIKISLPLEKVRL